MIEYFIRQSNMQSITNIDSTHESSSRHGHGPQRHTRDKSSSKSNSLHIELSFPIHVVINVAALYIRNSWCNQIRRQNIFTSLNCQRHCAPQLNPRPAFSIRFVCPYGRRIDYVRHFKVASFAAIAGTACFFPGIDGPL